MSTQQNREPTTSYDALLIVSFGGPEGMEDVLPFLDNVLRGRNVPPERKAEVAEHYASFGGVSPLNEQNRQLIAALKKELQQHDIALPIYWGNRNWHPLLPDTMRQMAADGITNALAFMTSAYSSYSSCRQYLEDIQRAQAEVGAGAPQVSRLRKFYNHPGFIQPNRERLQAALDTIPAEQRASGVHIAFTAHSIPLTMAQTSNYEVQLHETCRLVMEGYDHPWQLVYQSRSGSPRQPWLGPDIGEHLRDLQSQGVTNVVIAPIGFTSDHVEVLYDLDTEARALCDELGINMVRAATVGTHPLFVGMVRELIEERLNPGTEVRWLGSMGPNLDTCHEGCCLV